MKEERKSDSNLSNVSFELTKDEIAQLKREYQRDEENEDEEIFKKLVLEEFEQKKKDLQKE